MAQFVPWEPLIHFPPGFTEVEGATWLPCSLSSLCVYVSEAQFVLHPKFLKSCPFPRTSAQRDPLWVACSPPGPAGRRPQLSCRRGVMILEADR